MTGRENELERVFVCLLVVLRWEVRFAHLWKGTNRGRVTKVEEKVHNRHLHHFGKIRRMQNTEGKEKGTMKQIGV